MSEKIILNLAYHHVQAPGDSNPLLPDLVCSLSRFERQVEYLHTQGFKVMTCGALARALKSRGSLPGKVATLSFDDGFAQTTANVRPVLHQRKTRATFFVIGNAARGRDVPLVLYIGLRRHLGARASEIIERKLLPLGLGDSPYRFLLDPKIFNVGRTGLYANEDRSVRRLHTILFRMLPPERSEEVIREMTAEVLRRHRGDLVKLVEKGVALRDEFLGYEEVLDLSFDEWCEVAWHSATHPFLGDASAAAVEREVSEDVQRDSLGLVCDTFGWPFGGEFPHRVKKVVAQRFESAWNYDIGDEGIAKLRAFGKNPRKWDRYDIPRIDEAEMEKFLGIPPF